MMNLVLPGLGAAAGGLLLGALYFGGLWWTVRRLPTARHPAALIAGSFLLRAAVAAAGIVVIAGGEPIPLLCAVAGFITARTIAIRRVGAGLQISRDRPRADGVADSGSSAQP